MVLVPANMTHFDFTSRKKNCFWSLQNILFFKIVLEGTNFKTKIFCRDLFKNQKILQGPKTFFLQGLKPKRVIFAETKTIF